MIINTKYNINDSIYSMHDNKVLIEYISSILSEVTIDHNGNVVVENKYKTNSSRILKEDNIFTSKEELLKSL